MFTRTDVDWVRLFVANVALGTAKSRTNQKIAVLRKVLTEISKLSLLINHEA